MMTIPDSTGMHTGFTASLLPTWWLHLFSLTWDCTAGSVKKSLQEQAALHWPLTMHYHSKFNLPNKQKAEFVTPSQVTVTQAPLETHLAAMYKNRLALAEKENEPIIICPIAFQKQFSLNVIQGCNEQFGLYVVHVMGCSWSLAHCALIYWWHWSPSWTFWRRTLQATWDSTKNKRLALKTGLDSLKSSAECVEC